MFTVSIVLPLKPFVVPSALATFLHRRWPSAKIETSFDQKAKANSAAQVSILTDRSDIDTEREAGEIKREIKRFLAESREVLPETVKDLKAQADDRPEEVDVTT